MRKGTNKRSFIAPQPAAQIAALDFTHQSEAFRRAVAVCEGSDDDEAAINAASDLVWQIGDRLLGIPTTTPGAIAEKVEAFHYMHHTRGGLLRDPATQHRIADGNDDAAKGLLAIYLDLGGVK